MKRDYARERQSGNYRRLMAAKSRLNDVFYWRKHQAQSFWQHLAMLSEFRASVAYRKLLARQKEWLDGYQTAVRGARESELAWLLYLTPENRFVTDDQVPKGRWCDVRGGAHVWKHRLPEIKIYNASDETYSAIYTLNAYPAMPALDGSDGAVCPDCYEVGSFIGMGTWACKDHGHYFPPVRRPVR